MSFGITIADSVVVNAQKKFYGNNPTALLVAGNVLFSFPTATDDATVTNVGDGSGSFEVYNDTQNSWVAGVLSTSDDTLYTFNPTSNFTIGDNLTLHLDITTITDSGSDPYAIADKFLYKVFKG